MYFQKVNISWPFRARTTERWSHCSGEYQR